MFLVGVGGEEGVVDAYLLLRVELQVLLGRDEVDGGGKVGVGAEFEEGVGGVEAGEEDALGTDIEVVLALIPLVHFDQLQLFLPSVYQEQRFTVLLVSISDSQEEIVFVAVSPHSHLLPRIASEHHLSIFFPFPLLYHLPLPYPATLDPSKGQFSPHAFRRSLHVAHIGAIRGEECLWTDIEDGSGLKLWHG